MKNTHLKIDGIYNDIAHKDSNIIEFPRKFVVSRDVAHAYERFSSATEEMLACRRSLSDSIESLTDTVAIFTAVNEGLHVESQRQRDLIITVEAVEALVEQGDLDAAQALLTATMEQYRRDFPDADDPTQI